MTLRIHTIREDTSAEGPGRRFCVWVQGCQRHCPGCFAEDTWDPEGGYELGVEALCDGLARRIAQDPPLEGVTLLGGEPFLQAEALARFAEHAQRRGLSVFCFSGYTLEELHARDDAATEALLAHTDVLAAGPYLREERDLSRPWVGSRNQRFHFLTDRYEPTAFLRRPNRVEVRLRPDGSIAMNGMADFFDQLSSGQRAPREEGCVS